MIRVGERRPDGNEWRGGARRPGGAHRPLRPHGSSFPCHPLRSRGPLRPHGSPLPRRPPRPWFTSCPRSAAHAEE
ncbi:hypothetical protein D187_006016 [Cystobacter fuscus DSM 2262]|uniref:Uncharacterized protein n=1 Tax=Cystobacter fuscus (strain ATCC 25194 / DSM 2262 / NBRC 100088 / M29) TaxID=1242864 RepID=S9R418_CYSF2|nr:hypothetical protein D187_006016 [Cystobacter fuscus DSM 2262]